MSIVGSSDPAIFGQIIWLWRAPNNLDFHYPNSRPVTVGRIPRDQRQAMQTQTSDPAQWVQAIGSIITVLVALFTVILFQMLKPWFERPKLKIEFENRFPCCKDSPTTDYGDTRPAYWVRLRIRNIGRSSAQKCFGRMLEIHDGRGTWLERYDPETLDWRGIITGLITLAPGDFEYLDVWLTAKDVSDMRLRISDHTARSGLFDFRPGNYTIKIIIFSDNAKPVSQVFRVDWNGIYDQIKMHPEIR